MATRPSSVLVTDRTIADVINKTKKGFNNYSDVQRVQDWINYFIDEVDTSLSKYAWSRDERVDKTKWQTYVLDNVTKLLQNYPDLSLTVPTADNWDWQKQNKIENILLQMSKTEPVTDPVSFGTDSLATIVSAVKKGTYKTVYHVGDTKQIQMNDGKMVELNIIGKDGNLDDGKSLSNAQDKYKYSLLIRSGLSEEEYQYHNTASGFSYENKLSWENSNMRNIVMPQIKNNLPQILQNNIKEVRINNVFGYATQGVTRFVYLSTNDYLFIEGTGTDLYKPSTDDQSLPKYLNEEDGVNKWTRDTYVPANGEAKAYAILSTAWSQKDVTEKHKIRWIFCL